jgi:hypothetical protein
MTHASCQTAQPDYRISTRGFWAKLQAVFASSESANVTIAENNRIRASSRHWLM